MTSQRRLRDDVLPQFPSDDVVFISISVETNVRSENLAEYARDENFNWQFAIATSEMMISLVDTFGRDVSNPPRQPDFIIRPDGTTTDLLLGLTPASQTIDQIRRESG